MSDTEKQEGQKTVVAFIAGLLIGGLLVWVFSSSPSSTKPATEMSTGTETTQTETQNNTNTSSSNTSTEAQSTSNNTSSSNQADATKGGDQPQAVAADASISVADQASGNVVMLGKTTFPTNDGWVAVREMVDGQAGNILGASRYSINAGLVPTKVDLLRATEAGKTYEVVFYTENGDRVFDLNDDKMIEGVSATFKAQ